MGDKKRIAFVSNSLWSIFHFRIHIIRMLAAKGYEITVIAPPDQSLDEAISKEKVTFIALKNLHPRKMLPWQEWRLYRELKTLYSSISPDLIFHYTIKPNIIGSLAAGIANIKSIAIITGLGYTLVNNRKTSFLIRPLYTKALKSPAEIWFLNEGDRRFFVSAGMVPESKTFILPGEGVDTDFFEPTSDTVLPEHPFRFLMISRILNNKGVNEYVEAARIFSAINPNVEFVLMGKYEEDSPDAVSREIFDDWLNKKTIHYLPYSNSVKEEISKAGCIVLPSYAEGLSVSLMEAAAMAKPIIASDVSGCRELVIDKVSGFLCEPGSVDDLVEKLKKMVSLSVAERIEMGNRGRNLIREKYAVSIISDIYLRKIIAHLQAG
jgi:glycosyltransferase involved in cell wall biosynthesis